MDKKNWIIVVLAVAVVAFATLYFSKPAPTPPIGATPGGTIPGEQLCVNGVCVIYKQGALTSSSTPISVRNPFNATSTVIVEFETTGTSTSAISFDMGTSTLPSRPYTTAIGIAGMNLISSSTIPAGVLAHFKSGAVTNFPVGGLAKTELEVGPTESVILYATSTNAADWAKGKDGLIRDRTTWGGTYNLEFRRYQ